MKKINYRHIISIMITLSFLMLSIFVFPNALGRLIEGGRDIALSVAFYFIQIFGITSNIKPTVTELPKIPFFPSPSTPSVPVLPNTPSTDMPTSWELFQQDFTKYWTLWADMDNFQGYLVEVNNFLINFSMVICVILPIIVLLYFLVKKLLNQPNNDYDVDTKPLAFFKKVTGKPYRKIKRVVGSYVEFLKEHRFYVAIWLVIWAYNFNLFTIALEFFAFYFYFMISFDFGAIYRQCYKLVMDLSVMFKFIPWPIWIVIALVVFNWLCQKIAYRRLNIYERRNCGFINERPIVYMVCGTMGKKKTTAITDMALSQEVMFRDKAFEKILENDLKFPYFPWINLENELRCAMEFHEVYNLATVSRFIAKKKQRYEKRPGEERIFGYDIDKYGATFNDELRTVDIWTVIETYAKLYFIYIIQSSLLISNYSIRTDAVLSDLGNFPLWNSDFFKRDSRLIDSYSRHAHILDFDTLRLGRKVIENNARADMFEFGVVTITEVGKERGNNLELQEKKKKDLEANQKNDLFNSWLKMVRHSATVDNFPFVKVITDEQRPESWGADARDLCEIVTIAESGAVKLALPFFSLFDIFYDFVFGKFVRLYYDYRYIRGDNSLPMYLLKTLVAKVHHYKERTYNKFGVCTLKVEVESGTQDGAVKKQRYYLSSKKIYSKRFSTDCFSDFFVQKALRTKYGLDDLVEYNKERATFSELAEQNSYFVNDLLRGVKDNEQEEKVRR